MSVAANPYRGTGLGPDAGLAGTADDICTDPAQPLALYTLCPKGTTSPLHDLPDLASDLGIGSLSLKDERHRMGLGSFKALGAAYAIAKRAAARVRDGDADRHETALEGEVFVCASAGNHGLSVAAGARLFGARAVVYLAESVPDAFADRLRSKGATVVRAGAAYEAAMAAAANDADDNGWQLLSDSSWPGYTVPARDVMEGYLIMGSEVSDQIGIAPTHLFLQAGVGGLAAAAAAAARHAWGKAPRICVVEPDRAPALKDSIAAGRPVVCQGPTSNMGRLDCKEPSHLALAYLAREADAFMTITDAQAAETVGWLAERGLPTTPSGAAGVAGLHHADASVRTALGVGPESRVLAYLSEGPEDG